MVSSDEFERINDVFRCVIGTSQFVAMPSEILNNPNGKP